VSHDASGGALVAGLWTWTNHVLLPAQALKHAGVMVVPPPQGEQPVGVPSPGLGPRFSVQYRDPVLLDHPTEHDHLVTEFDRMGEIYDAFVAPFSTPIFSEAMDVVATVLASDARVLDAGCGAGRELRRVARMVPDGEVVGIDLAAGMVLAAHRAARSHGLDHCAFFQSDVGELPSLFDGQFDMVYNCLAHHHYPDPPAAARAIIRCLRPGGLYCVIDPGPAWFNAMSAGIAKKTDPGWIGFHTPDEYRELLLAAGFARVRWEELLPGFGLVTAQAPHDSAQPQVA
jgi:ubiquinone/menaquinone biosynthesis C-methylase UbiE